MAIVTELSLSLNHPAGGDVSKNLDELYGYSQKLLIQANAEQSDPPLAEVERLLSTLMEAWQSEKLTGKSGTGTAQTISSTPVGVAPGR